MTRDTGHLMWGENSLNMPAMLITDPPPTSTTGDTWQVTHERWHMTGDMCYVTLCVGWTFSQISALLLQQLGVIMFWRSGGKGSLIINELINYEAVCRTPLATPGLLDISPLLLLYEKLRKYKICLNLLSDSRPLLCFCLIEFCLDCFKGLLIRSFFIEVLSI